MPSMMVLLMESRMEHGRITTELRKVAIRPIIIV